jgi:acetylglutamate kinase
MTELREKANTLIEALPYIRRFAGKTVVIKYGGSAMGGPFEQVILDIVWLCHVGIKPVIVHGGGKEISSTLSRLGIEARFVDGLRITDAQTMDVVEMVLAGKINKRIVGMFGKHGVKAVGISGVDAGTLQVKKKEYQHGDLGQVGEITSVDTGLLTSLVESGFVPVVAPIGVDEKGERYNVNADSAAGAIAGALGAEKLVLLTDVPGIMRETVRGKEVISRITADEIRKLIADGTIYGGMVPKVEACLGALESGAKHVHIVNGEEPHALLLEVFTDKGIGTMVLGGDIHA